MNEILAVKLNEQEQALFDSICWDLDELDQKDHGERLDCLEKMGQLAESLFGRKAIPKVRLEWFTDPKLNAGGGGKSRKEVFEKNGTTGKDILRHQHFMKHLRYFLYGPDLPQDTIKGFCKIITDDAGTSGMVLDQITAFVRKEVREKRLDPAHAAEEFFKLAHEIGKPDLADSVRSAAKQVRR